jgi:hypothetical protein
VKFRVDMALLAEDETHPVAFYKYGPPGGGRKDRSVRPQVPLLVTPPVTRRSAANLNGPVPAC